MKPQCSTVQTATPPWMSGLMYVIALGAGVLLICSGKTNVTEASGYITPFLVIYERAIVRRR